MRYRYLDDFPRGISVFAIFSYGIAVLGTPQCPPPLVPLKMTCQGFVTIEKARTNIEIHLLKDFIKV